MSTAAARPIAGLALLLGGALAAQEGERLLRQAEALLCPWPAFRVELDLQGEGRHTRWDLAYGREALRLDGLEGPVRGRSLLVREGQVRLRVPGTPKPLPLKGGTLPGLSLPSLEVFALGRHFRVRESRPEQLDGRALQRLELEARQNGSAYRSGRLWIGPEGQPFRLELCLASGQVDQRWDFPPPIQAEGRPVLPGFTLRFRSGATHEARLRNWRPGPLPPGHFEFPEGAKGVD